MTEGIIVALISLVSSLLTAIIGAAAVIWVGEKRANPNCAAIMLGSAVSAVIGLMVGALFGVLIVNQINGKQAPPPGGIIISPTDTAISPSVPVQTSQPTQPAESYSATGNNIISNGNFENGLSGWTYDQRHREGIYTSSGYNGSSVCIRQDLSQDAAMSWTGIGQDLQVVPGQSYLFSGWLFWEDVTEFHIKAEWNRDSANWFPVMFPVNGNSGGWIFHQNTIEVPDDINVVRLAFWHGVEGNYVNVPGGIVCIDEVTLIPID